MNEKIQGLARQTATESALNNAIGSGVPMVFDPKKVMQITINKVLNGYVVNVGCIVVVFESREKLLGELKRYLQNPDAVAKEYLNKK